jgi:hypothetical protein
MVVSTLRPSSTAASYAPAPRWQGDDPQPVLRPVEQFGRAAGGVGMGEPVEAVTAKTVALPPLSGYGVGGGFGGDGGVEGGVETSDRGDVG